VIRCNDDEMLLRMIDNDDNDMGLGLSAYSNNRTRVAVVNNNQDQGKNLGDVNHKGTRYYP
jgi:hypothetical protein